MGLENQQADSQSSEDRLIELRTRSDLIFQESVFQGENCWIIKDPVAMKYFRLQLAEYLILKQLSKPSSYQTLQRLISKAFPEKKTRLAQIQNLVISFHRSGLLISNLPGQAKPLIKKRNAQLKQKFIGLSQSIIALRLPGFDPEWLLSRMYPKLSWLFSKWFACIVFTLCISAAFLVLLNFREFFAKLPEFEKFFAFENILFMGFLLVGTKTIHEFGHALMCKHYGGECHEIGFMLLVMTPVMYCTTSDSWILPNRWHRIAIGAAGMYLELFLAAICTFVWWFTNPGTLHYLALNVMFLSSVTTIVFNINPLLKYDGYYMLSDYLEIPNLASKSKLALTSKLRVLCLGMKPIDPRRLPARAQISFASYSVASFVYRWMVMIFIFWFINEIFEPYGLSIIAYIIICISLFGRLVLPGIKLVKFFMRPGTMRNVKKFRFVATTVILGLLIGFFCFFPISSYVYASFVIRPAKMQLVKVVQPGRVVDVMVVPGEPVSKGQVIAKLNNYELLIALENAKGRLAQLENELLSLQLQRGESAEKSAEIVAAVSAVKSQTEAVAILEKQIARFDIKATQPGIIVPAPNIPFVAPMADQLSAWNGTPLDQRNANVFVDTDTLLCSVGSPDRFQADLIVSQSDIKLVKDTQPVLLMLDSHRNHIFRSEVAYVSRDELTEVPRELSQTYGGPVPVAPTAGQNELPLLRSYRVEAQIDNSDSTNSIRTGLTGIAKIRIGNESMGTRSLRYLRKILNFR